MTQYDDRHGRIFLICGVNDSGKSTMARLLQQHFVGRMNAPLRIPDCSARKREILARNPEFTGFADAPWPTLNQLQTALLNEKFFGSLFDVLHCQNPTGDPSTTLVETHLTFLHDNGEFVHIVPRNVLPFIAGIVLMQPASALVASRRGLVTPFLKIGSFEAKRALQQCESETALCTLMETAEARMLSSTYSIPLMIATQTYPGDPPAPGRCADEQRNAGTPALEQLLPIVAEFITKARR